MKRISHVFSLATILLLVTAVSGLCENGQAVYDQYKKTEQLMEKALENIVMVLTTEGEGNITETTIYIKGKKRRMESVVKKSNNPMMGKPGDKTIMIDDGVTSTVFSPQFGKMNSPSEPDATIDETPKLITYLGKETVEGFECNKIQITSPYGEGEILWIATKGDTLVKTERTLDGEKTVTLNSKFKKVKGFLLPHTTQSFQSGQLSVTSTVTKIKTDAKLEESLFDPEMVEGYDEESASSRVPPITDQAQIIGQMMEMGMEIERLHHEGKTEEAQALQKKMKDMAASMGAPQ